MISSPQDSIEEEFASEWIHAPLNTYTDPGNGEWNRAEMMAMTCPPSGWPGQGFQGITSAVDCRIIWIGDNGTL